MYFLWKHNRIIGILCIGLHFAWHTYLRCTLLSFTDSPPLRLNVTFTNTQPVLLGGDDVTSDWPAEVQGSCDVLTSQQRHRLWLGLWLWDVTEKYYPIKVTCIFSSTFINLNSFFMTCLEYRKVYCIVEKNWYYKSIRISKYQCL